MRLFISVFVLILGLSQNIWAQQSIEKGSMDTISIRLKYKSNANVLQQEVNNALRAIAYTNQKPVETLQINWNLIVSYQVFRQEKGNFKSEILIEPSTPQGELSLYHFNSAEYLLPTLQSFRLRIFNVDSSLVYLKYFNQIPISVNSANQIAHFSIWHQRWAKGYYMKIDQFELNYHAGDYSFEQWFQFTNNYEAANYLVNDFLKNYRLLQESDQEPVPFLIKSLRLVDYLKTLYQMPFYQATVNVKKDPDGLKQKMSLLSTLLDLNIEKYVGIFKNTGSVEDCNVEQLITSYLLEDENLLALQQEYSSMYKELFKELSKTNYQAILSYKNVNIFTLLAKGKAVNKTQLILSFENSLYSKSIAKIDSLIVQQHFSEALFYIDNLEGFVKQTKATNLSDSFKQIKAIAAYGMYYSYIKVVDKAIQAKNLTLSKQYLRRASLVQENYPHEIITNGLVEKKKSQLLDMCFADYQQMINQNKYSEASAMRDNIRKLIHDFQLEDKDDMLAQLNYLDNQALKKQN